MIVAAATLYSIFWLQSSQSDSASAIGWFVAGTLTLAVVPLFV